MILLLDIGNTHTHVGLADAKAVRRRFNLPTNSWFDWRAVRLLSEFVGTADVKGAAMCSVVPRAAVRARRALRREWKVGVVELSARNLPGIGVDYPKPSTIGTDRLANAVAARSRYGVPVVVVDFGTAVTFDVVDAKANYVGGIIAPGMSAMTDYLHRRTALLPSIKVRETRSVIGRSTSEAMRIGAVRGYRGLVRELVRAIRREVGARDLHVVATGGYAKLIAAELPEIQVVDPLLTLEGLRIAWEATVAAAPGAERRAPVPGRCLDDAGKASRPGVCSESRSAGRSG